MKKNLKDFNPFFLKIINLNKKIEFIIYNYRNIKIANSLSPEDILLIYFFIYKKINIKNFLLNTGRLFLKNIILLEKIKKKYNIFSENVFSDIILVNKYVRKYTLNGFYNNVVLRKICCHIRKIQPLNKVLKNVDLWITGQRKTSLIRSSVSEYEYDKIRKIVKCNLLLNWDYKDIFYFIEKFNIITNSLCNFGYISIGCEPCTQPIKLNDDIRSGRWWWEKTSSKKECGLHNI